MPRKSRFTVVRAHQAATSDAPWHASDQRARVLPFADAVYYRSLFAQRDPNRPADQAGSWRLLHHEVDDNGDPGPASVAACRRAIGLINGAGRGVQIPDVDRDGVYAHLSSHIRDAGQEAPAFISHDSEAHMADDDPTGTTDTAPDPTVDVAPNQVFEPAAYAASSDDTVQCPACQLFNEDDASYCDQCGQNLAGNPSVPTPDQSVYKPAAYVKDDGPEDVQCPACNKGNMPDASFCDQCGIKLAGNTDVALPKDPSPTAKSQPSTSTGDADAPASTATAAATGEPFDTDPDATVVQPTGGNGVPYAPAPYQAQPDETVACPACSLMNSTDAVYCDQCGVELTDAAGDAYQAAPDEIVQCPSCSSQNDTDAAYCDQCGTQLTGDPSVVVSDDAAPDPDPNADPSTADPTAPSGMATKAAEFMPGPDGTTPAAPAAPSATAPAVPADPNAPVDPNSAAANSTSAMVAFYPDDPTPLVVQGDGASQAADIHLTLVFLGDASMYSDADSLAALKQTVGSFAADWSGSAAQATGFAVSEFGGPPDDSGTADPKATVLLMQGDDLEEVNSGLIEPLIDELTSAGIAVPDDFPVWYPHITIGYGLDPAAIAALVGAQVSFTSVSLVVGTDRTDYVLGADNADASADDDSNEADDEAEDNGLDDADEVPNPPPSRGSAAVRRLGLATDRSRKWQTVKTRKTAGFRQSARIERFELLADAKGQGNVWQGVLVVEGAPSGDGRQIAPGALTYRDLPLPLMAQFSNPVGGKGHDGAVLAGNITDIWRDGAEVWGGGTLDMGGPGGLEARRLISEGMLRGVSIDLDAVEVDFENPEPGVDASIEEWMDYDPGLMIVISGRVMGATLCSFPAFQEAQVALVEELTVPQGEEVTTEPQAIAASAGARGAEFIVFTPYSHERAGYALVASGGTGIPVAPPLAWFSNPHLEARTPVRITADGRVVGHVAAWGECHIGMGGRCVTPPRSQNGYANYRTGQVLTAEGTPVNTGPLTMDTVHPDLAMQAADARGFYDFTGAAIADVVVYEDEFGIAVAGALRPTASPEQVRAARGSDWSPDWRPIRGRLECVAMLAVNNTGFKVEALAASAGQPYAPGFVNWARPGSARVIMRPATGEITGALVAAGMVRHRSGQADAQSELVRLRQELDEVKAFVDPLRTAQARAKLARMRESTARANLDRLVGRK